MSSISFYDYEVSGEYALSYFASDSSGNITEVVIYLYVLSNAPVPNDYPEMDDDNLGTIIDRWDTERNKLSVKFPLDAFNVYEYYSSLSNLDGSDFLNELNSIITINQISYGEVRFVLEKSDLGHSVYGSYMHGMYDSHKLVRYWDGDVTGVTGTIDREHVWPKSYLTITSVENHHKNIASDPHNLRAILKATNTSRQNHYFVEGSGSNGNQGNGTYYPGDDHRGDVARILFYMYVRYNEDLLLTDSSTDIVKYKTDGTKINGKIPFGLLSKLLEWNELDPVDEFEIHRNNVIYMYQGNRNPFIDHPEYADIIFEAAQQTNEFIIIYAEVFIDTKINLSDLKPRFEELLVN